ncbi:MAG: hypothetical protein C4547_04050 [Phycisphaerales bacterium]|nr:MAG: hypothetical protein C4547_04050 [Phycisphaerales bacterium]
MLRRTALVSLLLLPIHVKAQVDTYECDALPEPPGWEVLSRVCDPETWLEDGWYHQRVDHRSCEPPGGGRESFVRSLAEYLGKTRFFAEVRLGSDGPRSEIPGGGPGAFALGSNGIVNYTFFIADDQAKLNRDNRFPIIFVDIEPGVPHTHRIESYDDDLYVWYIDGEIVDSGIPEGPFPSFQPSITWVGRAWYADNEVHWDYIRYGVIPDEGSSDFDSDEDVDLRDARYFAECLDVGWGGGAGGPGADATPGCRWADADGDTDVDLRDFGAFQNAFTGDGP